MRLTNRRTVRNLIGLVSLLAFASAPLAAQRGIDLLDAEQVLRGGASDGTATVRAMLAEDPTGVDQATHVRKTLQYDDGDFENFAEGSTLAPVASGGTVEWAQRFEVKNDSAVVSARACFLRPDDDLSRALDFSLRFYDDDPVEKVSYPGRRSGFVYTVESDIRRAGDHRCVLLRGHLVGKELEEGVHWVGIEWNTATKKRLAGDHYTAEDEAETDRTNRALHETEVRNRSLPVLEGVTIDGWLDPRQGDRTRISSGLKAIGGQSRRDRSGGLVPEQ